MAEALLGALALMLLIEGLMPVINPGAWRRAFEQALKLSDGQIRFVGVCSVLAGCVLLAIWRS